MSDPSKRRGGRVYAAVVASRFGNPAGGPIGSRHRQQLNGEFIAALLRCHSGVIRNPAGSGAIVRRWCGIWRA
jgi:hypothetical protein